MELAWLDIAVIGGYFVVSLALGLWFTRVSGKSSENFFLGGRNMPWWLAGISMVATTFAADTPLAVTELVAENGISGNWLWWNMLIGGMLTVFFFSKLWRKANILTDVELIELRYSGPVARFLRGFRAIYLGLFMNALVMGWVNLALMSLIEVFFEVPKMEAFYWTVAIMALVAFYTSFSGLLGVAATDVLQFGLAMAGTIVLAVVVLNSDAVGGMQGLRAKVPEASLRFFPSSSGGNVGETLALGWSSLIAFLGMQWWASWYPGAEPGGGGYVAQRMMSAKNERHAFWATFLFQAAMFCLRPWPWIITALCAVVIYGPLADPRLGYVMVMRDYLPVGLKGMLLASFLAAYMSTISTQLNWGAGYLINDFYSRFLQPRASQSRIILISRLATVGIMIFSAILTTFMDSIKEVWEFLLQASAGLGLVLILRWYWWRINAWAELTATAAPLLCYGTLLALDHAGVFAGISEFPNGFFITTAITTISWIAVMYATRPESTATLQKFYDRVKPQGHWPFPSKEADQTPLPVLALAWGLSLAALYGILFFIGKLLLGFSQEALVFGSVALFGILALLLVNRKWQIF